MTCIVEAVQLEKIVPQIREIIGVGTTQIDKIEMREATYREMFGPDTDPVLAINGREYKNRRLDTIAGLPVELTDGPYTKWATIYLSEPAKAKATKRAKK